MELIMCDFLSFFFPLLVIMEDSMANRVLRFTYILKITTKIGRTIHKAKLYQKSPLTSIEAHVHTPESNKYRMALYSHNVKKNFFGLRARARTEANRQPAAGPTQPEPKIFPPRQPGPKMGEPKLAYILELLSNVPVNCRLFHATSSRFKLVLCSGPDTFPLLVLSQDRGGKRVRGWGTAI